MKLHEIRQKNESELNELIRKTRSDIENIAKDVLQQKEKNVKKVGFLRKDIARMKTILREKELEKVINLDKEVKKDA